MTGIQWTDEVWNPTTGCDRVSAGCDSCYALKMAKRLKGMGQAKYQKDGDPRTSGPGFGLTVHPDVLEQPLHWREPRRVFVNSMSDLFHESVPDAFIACVFTVMAKAPQHTFQVLTKRHGRMRSLLSSDEFQVKCFGAALTRGWDLDGTPWPLPNVWLGVSAEDQKWADIRIPALLGTPAAVRFVSAEPLLGPVDLLEGGNREPSRKRGLWAIPDPPEYDGGDPVCQDHGLERCTRCRFLNWVIVGGESGPGARPMELSWAASLVSQCEASHVPVFVKQLGSVLGKELGAGSKGGDFEVFPGDLKVREFPRVPEMTGAS
jgi:protein gp37